MVVGLVDGALEEDGALVGLTDGKRDGARVGETEPVTAANRANNQKNRYEKYSIAVSYTRFKAKF